MGTLFLNYTMEQLHCAKHGIMARHGLEKLPCSSLVQQILGSIYSAWFESWD